MNQITIIGTGLIGGSLGLALKQAGFKGRIVGCDRMPVLSQAQQRGAIHVGVTDPVEATTGSDVVVLATPVGSILDLLERLGPTAAAGIVFTDVGSTKAEIVARAQSIFGVAAAQRFLATHPMAGKESGGIEHADASLFRDAGWVVTPLPGQEFPVWHGSPTRAPESPMAEYLAWLERIGARVITMDAARHDRLCAWISHLPQMMSTALAAALEEEFGDDPDLRAITGRTLREMTRPASSPYSVWRDIALTNTTNIQEALLHLEQRLAHLRENLRTRGLEEEFSRARKFKKD